MLSRLLLSPIFFANRPVGRSDSSTASEPYRDALVLNYRRHFSLAVGIAEHLF
jgi:hypothetical protein